MKITLTYYELSQKEFRSEKTLVKFLKGKCNQQILSAIEHKGKIQYFLELENFIRKHKYGE